MLKGKTVITLDRAVLLLLELHLRSSNTEKAPKHKIRNSEINREA